MMTYGNWPVARSRSIAPQTASSRENRRGRSEKLLETSWGSVGDDELTRGGSCVRQIERPFGAQRSPKGRLAPGRKGSIPLLMQELGAGNHCPPSRLAERWGNGGLSSGLQSSRIYIPLTCREDQEAFRGPAPNSDGADPSRIRPVRSAYVPGIAILSRGNRFTAKAPPGDARGCMQRRTPDPLMVRWRSGDKVPSLKNLGAPGTQR